MSDKSDYLRSLTTETLPSVSVYKLHEIADYIEQLENDARAATRSMQQAVTECRKIMDDLGKLR